MDNSNKIILMPYGGTCAWGIPYEEAGYTVINLTLPKHNMSMFYKQGDYLP